MLKRLLVVIGVVVTALIAGPANAAGGVECPPVLQICLVVVEGPGTPDPAPDVSVPVSTGQRQCVIDRTGEVVPCIDTRWGWFNNADDCYYQLRDPQPAAAEAVWEGRYPEGAVYNVTCVDPLPGPGVNSGWTWLPSAPEGYGATEATPGELAARAVDQMGLTGPAIGITVTPDKTGLVGVPVWLWTEVTPTTWGPNTATASIPGVSVTASAQAKQIVWDMGDGTTVTCPNAGTPYYRGAVESPTCDYVYVASSAGQPNDAYALTATTTWEVTWTGGGTSGSLTVTRSSSTTVRIGELQVLVTG